MLKDFVLIVVCIRCSNTGQSHRQPYCQRKSRCFPGRVEKFNSRPCRPHHSFRKPEQRTKSHPDGIHVFTETRRESSKTNLCFTLFTVIWPTMNCNFARFNEFTTFLQRHRNHIKLQNLKLEFFKFLNFFEVLVCCFLTKKFRWSQGEELKNLFPRRNTGLRPSRFAPRRRTSRVTSKRDWWKTG